MSNKGLISCNSRVSKEDQEFYVLKNKAAEYFRSNGVPQKIECILNDMFFDQPDDIYGYLTTGSAVISSHSEDSTDPSDGNNISNDKRRDSVNVALHWIHESLSTILKGSDPCNQTAVDQILCDFFMARFLEYQDVRNRETENQPPGMPVPEPSPSAAHPKDKKGGDKGKKGNSTEKPVPRPEPSEPVLPGSMAIGSVSLAVAKTGAVLQDVPLYKYITVLRNQQPYPKEIRIPVPLVTLLSCGKLSPGKLNLLEEVIVIPKAGQRLKQVITMVLELQKEMTKIINSASKTGPMLTTVSDSGALVVGFERPEQPLDLISEASNTLGLGLGEEIHLALNCAAHNLMDYPKGKYDVITGIPKTPDELVDMYEALISKYPAVVALIDPLRKEDVEQWERLSNAVGASCSLLSDVSKPQVHGSHEDPPSLPGVTGYILNQTNAFTVTDLIRVATEHKGAVIIGTTSGEPCSDDSLSDMVVGLGVGYVKLGGLGRGERLTKYNRLISIEEELAQQGILDSRQQHTSPLFVGGTDKQSST
ncbi:enolase 4 isoform X2 [Esox lucius]|uniref:phosphopyruvate hydratase n=1 Tax=Esox lucius TaxID=8010 RepID=A0A3P8YE05_ESOLU|nr:enolase 4 isoform X2 [Esox lucius]